MTSKRVGLAVLIALLTACGASTSVSGTWQEPRNTVPQFSHVLVVGVSPNSRVRRSFEQALSDLINDGRSKATPAVRVAPASSDLTAQAIAQMVRETGADGVLVTRLASRKVAAKETEGRTGVKTQRPANLNGGPGLVQLFSLDYNDYEEPGELSARSTTIVESSLYDAAHDGRLVYVMTTTSHYEEDRDDVIDEVTKAIARQLRRERLVR